jgi:transketolase
MSASFAKNRLLLCAARDARGFAIDAVGIANSGHLGMPLGCAEIGAALFGELLNFDPAHPGWINRDRFILSAGHGSMFLYAWLHLAGYKISLDDIKNFRKMGSVASGHPEFNGELGVECTTGPLGQGVANAVGIAMSSKKLAATFNTGRHEIFNNLIVCLCGDGCLQEGISSEACSLAGHWKLDNLILTFDCNGVTLDGALEKSQSEDVEKRFEAHGFEVFETNGNVLENFVEVFNRAKDSKSGRPKLIIAKTTIGLGIDEVAGTHKAHGCSGVKFADRAKQNLGLPEEKFSVSKETESLFTERRKECAKKYSAWEDAFREWRQENSELGRILTENRKPWESDFWKSMGDAGVDEMSTRAAAGKILQKIAERRLSIISGSADLFSSAGNYIVGGEDFSSENLGGRNVFFGVREHAMAAIANGISGDGIFRPLCSTFLVFSDYMRPAIRIAAMARLNTIFILSHDSVAVGEDGPTHQPVETMASLRCIPNLDVVRPADYEETIGAWRLAIENTNRPTALILSRQDLPNLNAEGHDLAEEGKRRTKVLRGAYVMVEEIGSLECIILASGSELPLAVEAARSRKGTRVVSVPCMEAFERQSDEYKDATLPKSCRKRISIEAGSTMPWHRYLGSDGVAVGVNDFGFSGKPSDLMDGFGVTLEGLDRALKKLR